MPGCHTQAKSLDVLMERIREAIELCLEVQGEPTSETCGYSAHYGCGVTSFSSRCTVVPVHSGETIGPGLLLKILRDCDMSREELQRLL